MLGKKRHISYALIFFLVTIIAFTIYSYFSKGIIFYLISSDVNSVINYLSSFEKFTVFLFIALVIFEVLFALIPPLVLYLVGGILFGPILGGIYALTGNIIGSGIAFQISKHWIRDFVDRKVPNRIKNRFNRVSEKHGPLAIFLLRLNPFTTTDLVSYIAGVSNIKFWKFLMSTGLGLMPLVFIQSYLGKSVRENPIIFKIFIILSILYVAGFIVLLIYTKIKKGINKNAKLSTSKKR
jgi:uncharacterized membrane protein YdjX (TVP38/TMEM64 family)